MFVGFFILGLFSEGLLRLIEANTPNIPMDGYSFIEWVGVVTGIFVWNHYDMSRTFYLPPEIWDTPEKKQKTQKQGQSQTTNRKSRQRISPG